MLFFKVTFSIFSFNFINCVDKENLSWAIGMRAARKSLLLALLDPLAMLRSAENSGDYGRRLALVEESQNLPSGDVWAEYCKRAGVPCGIKMLDSVKKYERGVIMKRK